MSSEGGSSGTAECLWPMLPSLCVRDNCAANKEPEGVSVLASDRIVPAELPPNSTPVLHTADNVIHRYEKANERKYLEEEIAWIRAHQQREKLTKSERRISRVVAMHRVRACMPRDIVCKGWRDVGLGPLYLGGLSLEKVLGHPELQHSLAGACCWRCGRVRVRHTVSGPDCKEYGILDKAGIPELEEFPMHPSVGRTSTAPARLEHGEGEGAMEVDDDISTEEEPSKEELHSRDSGRGGGGGGGGLHGGG